MTVRCQDSMHWAPRETDKGLARAGLAICKIFSPGPWKTFTATFQRSCDRFEPAPAGVSEARAAFIDRQQVQEPA